MRFVYAEIKHERLPSWTSLLPYGVSIELWRRRTGRRRDTATTR